MASSEFENRDQSEKIMRSEAEYLKIERDLNWPKKSDGYGHQQYYELMMGLKSKVRERSLSEGLPPSIYEDRLNKLLDCVFDLKESFDHAYGSKNIPDRKENEQVIWSHRSDNEVSGVNKEQEPRIYRERLLAAAATYLANPWLQDDQIDWIFLDSLIYAELAGYRELIFSGQALGKIHWAYMFSSGDIPKMAWYSIIMALTRFALRYLVPPLLIIALYALQFETAFQVLGVAYVAYLVLRAAYWPLRRRKEKLKDKAYKEHEDRLKKIMVAYWHCRPPVISLTTLRTFLDEAIKSGANFDGALFSILKRVETMRGEAFMPFTEPI